MPSGVTSSQAEAGTLASVTGRPAARDCSLSQNRGVHLVNHRRARPSSHASTVTPPSAARITPAG
jgi:hypothetical protein